MSIVTSEDKQKEREEELKNRESDCYWWVPPSVALLFCYCLFLGISSMIEVDDIRNPYDLFITCNNPVKRFEILWPSRLVACKIYKTKPIFDEIEEWFNQEVGSDE